MNNENKGQWVNISEYNVLDGKFHYFMTCSVCSTRIERLLGSSYPTNCPNCHSSMIVKVGAGIG